jgi:tRNA A22 N-methylase
MTNEILHTECCIMIEFEVEHEISDCLVSQNSTFQHKKWDRAMLFLQMWKNQPSEKRFHHPIRETRKEISHVYIISEQQQGLKHKI